MAQALREFQPVSGGVMNHRLLVLTICAGGIALVMAADQRPHYKPGLWNITVTLASAKPASEKICIDQATETLMYQVGTNTAQKACSSSQVHSNSSQITVDAVCQSETSKHTVHSVTNFTGDTAFHADIASHYETPVGRPDSKSTLDGKWMGACPSDMKPGDAVVSMEGLAQPMRMNLKDLLSN
jgi:Protein of unknown function (DUF3617)